MTNKIIQVGTTMGFGATENKSSSNWSNEQASINSTYLSINLHFTDTTGYIKGVKQLIKLFS